MNSKGHLVASIVKSAIRIVGAAMAYEYGSVQILAGSLLIAEILGIFEELLDMR